MKDVLEVIKNIQSIYESDVSFQVLKDFEKPLFIEILKYTNYNQLLSSELLVS